MNIFVLSENYCPVESANMQCDEHIRKMGLESCQLLQLLFPLERLAENDCPRTQKGSVRKWFNPKHPCGKWVLESKGNVDWLILHARAQFQQFRRRYGKVHFTESFLDWVEKNYSEIDIPNKPITKFPIAINEKMTCRQVDNFDNFERFEQYRLFYKMDKPFASWEKGVSAPDWF
jgi:hypothetical protein